MSRWRTQTTYVSIIPLLYVLYHDDVVNICRVHMCIKTEKHGLNIGGVWIHFMINNCMHAEKLSIIFYYGSAFYFVFDKCLNIFHRLVN